MTTLHEIRAEYELAEKYGNSRCSRCNSRMDWEDVTLLHDHIGILLNNIAELETALHNISLCSANSMSNKEECGRIARQALGGDDDTD